MAGGVRRIVLEGAGRLEDVPAMDIAEVIEGVVGAVTKAAGHVVGRAVKERGRRESVVAAAGVVRLLELNSGSVEFVFAPAAKLDGLEGLALDTESLGERALAVAVAAAGEDAPRYRDVARVWLKTAERVGIGERYERMRIMEQDGRELVRLDATAVDALREVVSPPREVQDSLVQGRLYEANFDAMTAQLRGPAGEIVQVQYDQEQADAIYRVLRGPADLVGDITYDPETLRALRVRVREVRRPVQLDLSFWEEKPLSQIISEQRLERVLDSSRLIVEGLSHTDWEELRAAIQGNEA
jgi:hypothetical protein